MLPTRLSASLCCPTQTERTKLRVLHKCTEHLPSANCSFSLFHTKMRKAAKQTVVVVNEDPIQKDDENVSGKFPRDDGPQYQWMTLKSIYLRSLFSRCPSIPTAPKCCSGPPQQLLLLLVELLYVCRMVFSEVSTLSEADLVWLPFYTMVVVEEHNVSVLLNQEPLSCFSYLFDR